MDKDRTQFIRELITIWRRPDAAIGRARQMLDGKVWIDRKTKANPQTRFIGPSIVHLATPSAR